MGFSGSVRFRCVALRYVILKFLKVNLFLFRVHKCFLQMLNSFSWRHRLQFLLALSYSLQLLSTFPFT